MVSCSVTLASLELLGICLPQPLECWIKLGAICFFFWSLLPKPTLAVKYISVTIWVSVRLLDIAIYLVLLCSFSLHSFLFSPQLDYIGISSCFLVLSILSHLLLILSLFIFHCKPGDFISTNLAWAFPFLFPSLLFFSSFLLLDTGSLYSTEGPQS